MFPLCHNIPFLPCVATASLNLHGDQILPEISRRGIDGEALSRGSLDGGGGKGFLGCGVDGVCFCGGGGV